MKSVLKCLVILLLAALMLPMNGYAWDPGICILGPGDGVSGGPSSDDLSTNGQDATDTWKTFRWQAGRSGEMHLFCIRIQSIPGSVTNENLTYAVYEDNGGSMGGLKVWGYNNNYNWHTVGVGRHYFDLTQVVTNRTVVAGRYYWISLRSSTDNNGRIYWERQGADPLPSWVIKKGVVRGGDWDAIPPSSGQYTINYNPNYYGWSLWTAQDQGLPPPVSLRLTGGNQ